MGFTATATTIAGRNGHVETDDAVVSLDLAIPKPDGTPGKPNATNPEALFAAGYSACYGQALIAVAGAEKIRPEQVRVTAAVTLNSDNDDYRLSVVLKPSITGIDRAQAEALAHRAHEVCPYSNATRGNIDVALTANGTPID